MLLFFHSAVIYLGFVVEIRVVFCLFALVREFKAKDTLNTEKGTQLRGEKPC